MGETVENSETVEKSRSSDRTKSITVRVTKTMGQWINEMVETEGYSNRADVVYVCTRLFIEHVRSYIKENYPKFKDDESKYRSYMTVFSVKYTEYDYYAGDKSESENVTFRITKKFYEIVERFNFETTHYRNVQTFMRIATAWYYNNNHMVALGLKPRDNWTVYYVPYLNEDSSENNTFDEN